MPFSLSADIYKLASSFLGIQLPPRPAIYLGLFLVVLLPLVVLYQYYFSAGHISQILVILTFVVLAIYLYVAWIAWKISEKTGLKEAAIN